jgi:hypothetical protein
MALRSGENHPVEQEAEKALADGRRAQDKGAEKIDYLSREQMILRQSKEILNEKGVPDAHLVRGLYKRAYNPEAGKRPTKASKSED